MSEDITGMDSELRIIISGLKEQSLEPGRQAAFAQFQRQERLERVSRLMDQSQIPAEYLEKTFDNFTVTPENQGAVEGCREYAARWEHWRVKEGMAIFGDIGVGKSHLAAAVVMELIKRHGVAAIYANVLHSFEMIRWSFDTQEQNPLRKMLLTPLLVMDDLGSERPTVWTLEQVSHIMEYRLSEGLAVFVTSNALNWSGLAEMLTLEIRGDRNSRAHMRVTVNRIIDRLRAATGTPLIIRGKSRRRS